MRKPSPFKVGPNATGSLNYSATKNVGTFLGTLSTMFPAGEEFFVNSVRAARVKLRSSDSYFLGSPLDKDIGTFIGHESYHTLAHDTVNSQLYKRGFDRIPWLDKLLSAVGTKPLLALHVTAVLEHYTATLARIILDDAEIRSYLTSEELDLWEYHAIDEWDHKAVSWDTLVLVDKHRGYLFIPVSIGFIGITTALYIKNGGRWDSVLARKLVGKVPELLRYMRKDYEA